MSNNKQNNQNNISNKQKIVLSQPILFPELNKPLKTYIKYNKLIKVYENNISEFASKYISNTNLSIFKKLFNLGKKDINLNHSELKKNILNTYLKKLVEFNKDNFPKELGENEYKININNIKLLSKEERRIKLIEKIFENNSTNKKINKINNNNQNYSLNLTKNKSSISFKEKGNIYDNIKKRKESVEYIKKDYEEIINEMKNKNNKKSNGSEDEEGSYEGEKYINDEEDDSQNYHENDDDEIDEGVGY